MSGYAWLPDRKGTVTGFVVAGFGAGAAVFDAVATAVVNPTDAPTDYSTGYYGEVRSRRQKVFLTSQNRKSRFLTRILHMQYFAFRRADGVWSNLDPETRVLVHHGAPWCPPS